MPLTAASGPITEIEELWRHALASSATVQTWLGVGTVDLAKDKIFPDATPPPASNADAHAAAALIAQRPLIEIWTEDENIGYSIERIGELDWSPRGQLHAWFEENTPDATDPADSFRTFKNTLGNVIEDLIALAHVSAGMLAIERLSLRGPQRVEEKAFASQGDHHVAIITADWGFDR